MTTEAATFPRRVRIGSQTGTAVRRATPADDELFTDYLPRTGTGPILRPRSIVHWDGRFTTSTADRALVEIS